MAAGSAWHPYVISGVISITAGNPDSNAAAGRALNGSRAPPACTNWP
jgi:hypothetical protein